MFLGWDVGIPFILYALVSIVLIASYIYFIVFERVGFVGFKEKPSLEEIPPALLLNRSSQEWWLWLTHPLEKIFLKRDVHPHTLGLISFFITSFSLIGFSFGWFVLAGGCVLLGGTCGIFHKRLLKKQGLLTQNQTFLNFNLDLLGESLMFLGLLDHYTNTLFFYVVFIAFLSFILIHFSKIREEGLGITTKIPMLGRFERMIWIGISSIFSPLISAFANYFFPMSNTWLASVGITIVAILGAYSCYQWFDFVYKKLK